MLFKYLISMVANPKSKSKTKKISDEKILKLKVERKPWNTTESNVSVITKNTNPKVVIQSENINDDGNISNQISDKHLFLKLICFIVMCTILLITFFLSLKTYNAVNELSDYIHRRIQP